MREKMNKALQLCATSPRFGYRREHLGSTKKEHLDRAPKKQIIAWKALASFRNGLRKSSER